MILILSLIIGSFSQALTPKPAPKQAKKITFINATVHVGNGKVLENAQLSFSNGTINMVGYSKMPYTGDEIDLKGAHIYPGLILMHSNLGLTEIDAVKATRDFNEAGIINPSVRSIIAYNTDSERIPALRNNGILLAQVAPMGGLVSGTSSVVQLDAWNWEDAIVKEDNGLYVSWPNRWSRSSQRNTIGSKLEPSKTYEKNVSKIKALFEDAKVAGENTNNLKLNAVKPVFSKQKKLFVIANDPKSIVESIDYFLSLNIQPVLVSGQAAVQTLDYLKKNNISIVLSQVHGLPGRNDASIDAAFQLPAILDNAGLQVGLSYSGTMSSRNLSFTAGTAVNYGLKPEKAIQLMTLNNAKILGIDDKYGSLENGKSATFVISKGDILDMRSHNITDAYIDGRKINLHSRQQELYERYKKKLKQD